MKVKLQKQFAYKYKEKKYYKHVIVVPDDAVTELCLKGGQELELTVTKGQLIVKPKSEKADDGAK